MHVNKTRHHLHTSMHMHTYCQMQAKQAKPAVQSQTAPADLTALQAVQTMLIDTGTTDSVQGICQAHPLSSDNTRRSLLKNYYTKDQLQWLHQVLVYVSCTVRARNACQGQSHLPVLVRLREICTMQQPCKKEFTQTLSQTIWELVWYTEHQILEKMSITCARGMASSWTCGVSVDESG